MSFQQAMLTLRFFCYLLGNGYHPDNLMGDYVDEKGKAFFSDKQIELFQEMHDQMMKTLDPKGSDFFYKLIYTFCDEVSGTNNANNPIIPFEKETELKVSEVTGEKNDL